MPFSQGMAVERFQQLIMWQTVMSVSTVSVILAETQNKEDIIYYVLQILLYLPQAQTA